MLACWTLSAAKCVCVCVCSRVCKGREAVRNFHTEWQQGKVGLTLIKFFLLKYPLALLLPVADLFERCRDFPGWGFGPLEAGTGEPLGKRKCRNFWLRIAGLAFTASFRSFPFPALASSSPKDIPFQDSLHLPSPRQRLQLLQSLLPPTVKKLSLPTYNYPTVTHN